MCPLVFFRCFFSNSGAYTELWTISIILYTEVAGSDSISHNQVQVLSIPVLLLTWDLVQKNFWNPLNNNYIS